MSVTKICITSASTNRAKRPAKADVADQAAVVAQPADKASYKLPRTYYLYLLECKGKKLYCGIAIDVQARYERHVLGLGARYTRAFPPIRLLASVACGNRSEAQKAEYAMKQLTASQKRAFIMRNGIAGAVA